MNDEERKQLERLLSMASDEEFKQAVKKRKGTTKPAHRPRLNEFDIKTTIRAYYGSNRDLTKAGKKIKRGIDRGAVKKRLARIIDPWRLLIDDDTTETLCNSLDNMSESNCSNLMLKVVKQFELTSKDHDDDPALLDGLVGIANEYNINPTIDAISDYMHNLKHFVDKIKAMPEEERKELEWITRIFMNDTFISEISSKFGDSFKDTEIGAILNLFATKRV